MFIYKFQKEAYFYLFNLGVAAASLGVLLWLGFYTGLINTYPLQAHGNIMFFSFLFSFVMGFLMTAIPKMTRSAPTSNYEILTALALCSSHLILGFTFYSAYSIYIYPLQLVFLSVFILKRFLKTRRIPFAGFIFLPFAFALAFFGIIWTLFFASGDLKYFYIFCGEAFILNLICGIGARLVPVICRIPSALNPDQADENPKYLEFFMYGLLLNSSFLLEFFDYNQSAYTLRVVFLVIFAVLKFKVLQKPIQSTSLGIGLKVSILSLILGYVLVTFNLGGYLAGMHIIYVSGYTLLTLMIASRVAIAHGQRSLNLEINSKPLLITIVLFVTAAILRYAVTANTPVAVLITAVIIYLIALWNWKFFILRR